LSELIDTLVGSHSPPERKWDNVKHKTSTAVSRDSTLPKQGFSQQLRKGYAGYLFLLPTFAFLAYFMYYPLWTALYGAFTDWDGFNPPQFVGIENFQRAFRDPILGVAAINNLIIGVFGIILAIAPPFLVAELIFHLRSQRWQYAFRSLFVVPVVVPTVVYILLWTYYLRGDGLLNQILDALQLGSLKQIWLGNTRTAIYAISLMGFPWIVPFNLLIFYAGLQSISATGWKRISTIDIPLLIPQFKLIFILSLIGASQKLLEPLLMTSGGPGYSTTVPVLYSFQTAFEQGKFGYSLAISFILFVLILILSFFNARFEKEQ
jgi:raffinose/stachyose/melibiose transport system permease protein